ncbi:hypothetical protein P12x_001378 [Tundrisphaera lichenicola]
MDVQSSSWSAEPKDDPLGADRARELRPDVDMILGIVPKVG